jgi:hypothetical protein
MVLLVAGAVCCWLGSVSLGHRALQATDISGQVMSTAVNRSAVGAGKQSAHVLAASAGGAGGAAAHGTIGFLLYLPEGYGDDAGQQWPVVFFLHGSGESDGRYTRGSLAGGGTYDEGVNTLQSVAAHGLPHRIAHRGYRPPCVVVSPQAPASALGDWSGPALVSLEALAAMLQVGLSVDSERVYLTGLSMGGAGTWTWAASAPQRFAAVAPIASSGIGVQDAQLDGLINLPTWVIVGANDVIMAAASDAIGARVRGAAARAGVEPSLRLTRYSHCPPPHQPNDSAAGSGPASQDGHDSWTRAYADPEFMPWLFQHRRDRRPAAPRVGQRCHQLWAPGEHRIDISVAQSASSTPRFSSRSFLLMVPRQPHPDPATGAPRLLMRVVCWQTASPWCRALVVACTAAASVPRPRPADVDVLCGYLRAHSDCVGLAWTQRKPVVSEAAVEHGRHGGALWLAGGHSVRHSRSTLAHVLSGAAGVPSQ